MRERIGEKLRPLLASAAIRFAATALLTFGPFACPPHHAFANNQAATSAKPDPEYLAKKAEIFKKFHVRQAKPGEYPITVLPSDRVLPVMHDVVDVGDIAWLDNDTIIYVPQTGQTWEEINDHPGSLWLNSLNLKTLEAKRIAKASADHFCYDYETHNIRFVGVTGDDDNQQRAIVYGKLGGPLSTFVPPPRIRGRAAHNAHQPQSYTNHLDCTFYPVLAEPGTIGRTVIRTADGYLGKESANGKDIAGGYVLKKPDGTVKNFSLGQSLAAVFNYDYFSKLYWHSETLPDHRLKVWRFDKDFNIVAEEIYPRGPWGIAWPDSILRTSLKPGFIVGGAMYGGKLTASTKIHDLTYLITKSGTITEIAEDELGATFSVSPDGCKAATVRYVPADRGNPKPTGEIAIVSFCKKS